MYNSSVAMGGSPAASHSADTASFNDDFMQYCYKVEPCMLSHPHGWKMCPFVHPGEPVKRRHPSTHRGDMCPALKKGLPCEAGDDACPYAHNSFELWLHPKRFKTKMCRSGAACSRGICFFAHSDAELKQRQAMPTVIPGPTATAALAAAAANAAAAAAAAAAACPQTAPIVLQAPPMPGATAPAVAGAAAAAAPWVGAGMPAAMPVPQMVLPASAAPQHVQVASIAAGNISSGGCSPCAVGVAPVNMPAPTMAPAAQAAEQLLLLQQHHRQFEQLRLLQEIDNKLQMLQLLHGGPVTDASVAAAHAGAAPMLLNTLPGVSSSCYNSTAPYEAVIDPLAAMRSSAAATTAALLSSPTASTMLAGSTMLAAPWNHQQMTVLGSSPRSSNGGSRSASPAGAALAAAVRGTAASSSNGSSRLCPPSLPNLAIGAATASDAMDLLARAAATCAPANWSVQKGTMLI